MLLSLLFLLLTELCQSERGAMRNVASVFLGRDVRTVEKERAGGTHAMSATESFFPYKVPSETSPLVVSPTTREERESCVYLTFGYGPLGGGHVMGRVKRDREIVFGNCKKGNLRQGVKYRIIQDIMCPTPKTEKHNVLGSLSLLRCIDCVLTHT